MDWVTAERRETRKTYRALKFIVAGFALMFVLSVLAGASVLAAVTAAGALFGAFQLLSVRKHGVWGGSVTAGRFWTGAAVGALIGLVFGALAVLNLIDGRVEAALAGCVPGTVAGLVFGWLMYVNGRFVEDAAAAVAPEPVRAVAAELRGLLPAVVPRAALVLTDTRVAEVHSAAGGMSEVDSIAIADIARMETSLSSRGASLALRGGGTELAVRRTPAPQVYRLSEALRQAGVPEEE